MSLPPQLNNDFKPVERREKCHRTMTVYRWASARRGGMTVLGKVAVPKPINLPSQRLENHGLDPNVEIVPKGTHSWGSKSSSSSSNAWGSSSLSPNTDGGTGSPSYLSGRPSSGGTGTRPSTAGSDRAHDPVPNAWGPGSRPSSSSGVLPSNQTSQTALRPHSAETRPGSSQLSRFAEPISNNSAAWGGSGTSEKLGVASFKNDGFSLSTGDFPSLGSEKDNSGKNVDSQDYGSYGRPGSSSSGVASVKEHTIDSVVDVSLNVNAKAGGAGFWRRDSSIYGEDGTRSTVEKWHANPQPYPSSNIHHSQHFDSWHGPVNNHPGGVWYRGPPGGPPFGSPVPPGGFPMEPFPYFHPQMPPPNIVNQQPVRPPNTTARGSHPKNGDMYRPHMHDTYVRPGMPIRPGFYPGTVPYENYYGPPMGYCNSNERDLPFMGMAMGRAAYNRYPGHNVPDPGNSFGRMGGHGPSVNPMVSEQVDAVHPQETQGPYKVLLKQRDSWEGGDQELKWDDNPNTNSLHSLNGETPRKSLSENGRRTDDRLDDEMDVTRTTIEEGSSCEAVDNQAVPLKMKSPENVVCQNSSDDCSIKKSEHATSNFPEVLAPKDSSLIQKIEGLNAKARACEVRQDVKPISTRKEQKSKLHVGNMMDCHSTNEAGDAAFAHEKAYGRGIINSAPHEDRFTMGDKSFESTVVGGAATDRKSTHGKADHRVKMRFNNQEVDGWCKRTNVLEVHAPASSVHSEISYVSPERENSCEATQNSTLKSSKKVDSGSVLHVYDVNESQHAKMKELAKRIKQREKEEEERTRDQRAKALAKLEELNRRTQVGESVAEKLGTGPSSVIQSRQESRTLVALSRTENKAGSPGLSLGSNENIVDHNEEKLETVASSAVQNKCEESSPSTVVASKSTSGLALGATHGMIAQSSISSVNEVGKSTITVGNVSLETPMYAHNEVSVMLEQSKPSRQDGNYVDAVSSNSSCIHDVTDKQKRSGYRQKPTEKNSNDKSTPSTKTVACKGHSDIVTNPTILFGSVADENAPNCQSSLSVSLSVASESSAHHRKKNRSGKNRYKVEEAPSAAIQPSKDTVQSSGETVRPKTCEAMLVPSLVQPVTNSIDVNQSLDQHSSLANECGHIRSNSQWKSQHPYRTIRNQPGAKSSDKNHGTDGVVWAPVRLQNKNEVSDDATQNASVEAAMTGDQLVHNNQRNKRAELERYIPKPVAKELSHQGSSHQAIVPSNKITSDEVVERHECVAVGVESSQTSSGSAKVGSTIESHNGDVRQNKPGKVYGSWRQRGMAESTTNPSRNFHRSFEDHQHADGWNDGWNTPENPDTAVNVSVSKDPSVNARGKRHQQKGHKGVGFNHNPDEKRTVRAEAHQTEPPVAAKENHGVGERLASHWQPKPQPLPATDQQGSQPNRSINVLISEGGRGNIKELTHRGGSPLLPRPDKDTTLARSNQFKPEKTNFEETLDVESRQAPKRERRTPGRGGLPTSPLELSSHSNMDVRHDKHVSGSRRNGNASSRYSREHESHGKWSGSGKDNKQHPAAWERQKNNVHYEYQPVGTQNNNKSNNLEPPKVRSHNSGPRYRERGQGQQGGGNSSGLQSGSAQVHADCE